MPGTHCQNIYDKPHHRTFQVLSKNVFIRAYILLFLILAHISAFEITYKNALYKFTVIIIVFVII